jgi:hypothetical protein
MPKAEVFSSHRTQRSLNAPRPLVRAAVWALAGLVLLAAFAQDSPVQPGWWQSRSMLKQGAGAVDYAPANQGQLKNFARAARDEMMVKDVITAGHPIDLMVNSWSNDNSKASDYSPVNLGQLKAVAQPFYDRFIEVGVRSAGSYPWSGTTLPANDYSPANIGQLKAVFAFEISELDPFQAWEQRMFGGNTSVDRSPDADPDGDGVSNYDEYLAGTNPNVKDSKAINLEVYILTSP